MGWTRIEAIVTLGNPTPGQPDFIQDLTGISTSQAIHEGILHAWTEAGRARR
jgi:hypothetical protein